MNWLEFLLSLTIGASLILAYIHALIWAGETRQWAHPMFVASTLLIVVIAILELALARADQPHAYAAILRWIQVPAAMCFITFVLFVHLRFQAGRLWLGVLACLLKVAALVPNFTVGENLNFVTITSLERLTVMGGGVLVPHGSANAWMIVGQLANLLLVLFLLDAARRGYAKRLSPVGLRQFRIAGGMAAFTAAISLWWLLVVVGGLAAPIVVSPAFLLVLLVMSYELGGEHLSSVRLTKALETTETDLRQVERRMQDAVDAASLGLWNWDIGTNLTWMSGTGRQLLGLDAREEIELGLLLKRIEPGDRKAVLAALRAALAGRDGFHCEFRIDREQGSRRWIAARGQVDFYPAARARQMRGVLVDVSERKFAEERFRVLVEAAPTAMLVLDDSERIILANRQAELVFGYDRTELVGMVLAVLVPRPPAEEVGSLSLPRSGASMPGVGHELPAIRKDGEVLAVEMTLNPVELSQGSSVLVSVTDITARKAMERESSLQREELAHLSRVALLAELSGSLAHELNQPLTAILSNAQAAVRYLAHDPPNLPEVSLSLANIVESDKRAGEVIRRLRAMLRKERLEFASLDMNEVITDVLRIVSSDLLGKRVEIALELAPVLPRINGDRVQLQQVVLNLLVNGSDAMQALATGRLLRVRTQADGQGGLELAVCDVGSGIAPEDLARIFSPFVTTKRDGMGLGLAVCTSIIESHRGRLWASNNEGPGATLHVSLPGMALAPASVV